MRLLWVELDRYRNLAGQRIELHPRYNLLVGDNGQGKTNFLEAVSYLGTLKSFRNAARGEMIRQGEEVCRVAGRVRSGSVEQDVAFALTGRGRAQFLNDQKVSSPEKYLASLRLVSFIPEDVGLVSGSPSWRRRVIDRSVFEVVPGYVTEYRKYLATLRQRNTLLRKRGYSSKELESWTSQLADVGCVLIRRRLDLLGSLGPAMADLGVRFGFQRSLGLSYQATLGPAAGQQELAGMGREEIRISLAAELTRVAEREARAGHSLAGPHRDNVLFTINGHDMSRFASQGQKRSAVLSMKLALAGSISSSVDSYPIVLLDDVASELDTSRRQALGQLVRETKAQFFVTTTSEEAGFLDRNEGFVFEVKDGQLARLE
jgi:DNA replication and repair protein RecF